MARNLTEIEREVMELPPRERALLVEHLLATLDKDEDTNAEELWLQEAERRYDNYRAGKIGAKSANQVFIDAKKRVK